MKTEAFRIAGEKIGAERGGDRVIEVHNPFTRELVGTVPKASVEEVRRALAIAAGCRARLSRAERAGILERAAAAVRERTDEIAALITAESGLSLVDSRHEAHRVADVLHFGAAEALRDDGETFRATSRRMAAGGACTRCASCCWAPSARSRRSTTR